MSEETEKALALLQYEGVEWFQIDGRDDVFLAGTLEEADTKWEEYVAECEEDNKEPDSYEKFIFDNYEQIEVEDYNEDTSDYLVYTDDEADDAWDIYLDNFIDECVLPEIPAHYRNYFDDEKYKQDCKHDGRGHSLASYDGHENEETVNGTTYYIYRVN